MKDIESKTLRKLDKIAAELDDLRRELRNRSKPLKLRGIWKGVKVSERDIDEAKRALFKAAHEEDL